MTDATRPAERQRRRRIEMACSSLAHCFLSPLRSQMHHFLAPRDLYSPVKEAMLADGHAVASGLVMAAVLVNHIRRVLYPWLGQFFWWHPVLEMKLARGTPHYFVEEQLVGATNGEALCIWLLQTAAVAGIKALLRHRLLSRTTTTTTTTATATATTATGYVAGAVSGHAVMSEGPGRGSEDRDGGGGGATRVSEATSRNGSPSGWLTDSCRVLYLALCLTHVEYAYAETCWAASWIHASTHLHRRGTAAEREFAHRLLTTGRRDDDAVPLHGATAGASVVRGHWRGLFVIVGLLLWWSWGVLQPFRRHGILGVGVSGLAVLAGLVGVGTAYVIRYSNKYFIWLEMSEMLLTWVWMALGVLMVASWRLSRPNRGSRQE